MADEQFGTFGARHRVTIYSPETNLATKERRRHRPVSPATGETVAMIGLQGSKF